MTIQIDYETERELGIDYEALVKKVAEHVLDMEECPYEAQVNLVLTDNEEIKRVNTEFRNIERATDVLSFPMIPLRVLQITGSWKRTSLILTWIQGNCCWEIL